MQSTIQETAVRKTPNGVATVAQTTTLDTPTQTAANIIYFILGVIEVLLFFRFFLKVTGANPGSGFVAFIYSFTQMLVFPFQGIFSSAVTTGAEVRSIFEPATIMAMLVYAVIAWGAIKLLVIVTGHSSEEV